ncbi:MAG: DUF2750 domain-containing protein [Myxococcales bacterium]|jgi:hypothetical protein|nr:DUF2750 domain-containing protein [Myxococcales bacterium]
MNPDEKLAPSGMEAPERYDHFIRTICEKKAVWGLYDEGWAAGKVEGIDVIPVWPERELAAACATGDWATLSPREIALDDFVSKWIPGATADSTRFAVFPTATEKAAVVDNAELLADIEAELAPDV